MNDLLHAASVGVVAQKSSPYSNLVTTNKMSDYWIHGLPVIASRLDAVAALCDDNTLEYYEAGNARSLADALVRLYEDPARRQELVRNGDAAAERYGWTSQKREYLSVYKSLFASGGALRPRPSTRRPRSPHPPRRRPTTAAWRRPDAAIGGSRHADPPPPVHSGGGTFMWVFASKTRALRAVRRCRRPVAGRHANMRSACRGCDAKFL